MKRSERKITYACATYLNNNNSESQMTVYRNRDLRTFEPELATPERGSERMERFYQLPDGEQEAYWQNLRERIDRERSGKLERARQEQQRLPEDIHERLLSLDTARYVEAIAGVDVQPDRRICCPLPDHDDNSHDFRVYPDDRGWHCFGCNRGGNVYNLASAIWNLPLSGQQFKQIQQRLYEMRLVA